jgi:hypothetical protein
MCIGLSVSRPEAAIADASRLVINAICPQYLTAESFLLAAQFMLTSSESQEAAHGGFSNSSHKTPAGTTVHRVTGIMPIYLFKEHWEIAKRKIQPVFGYMCTLDIMGYTSEQYFTIPFLVYARAIQQFGEEPKGEAA